MHRKLASFKSLINSAEDDNVAKAKTTKKHCLKVVRSVREIATHLNIFYGSTQHISINVLGMKRVNEKI